MIPQEHPPSVLPALLIFQLTYHKKLLNLKGLVVLTETIPKQVLSIELIWTNGEALLKLKLLLKNSQNSDVKTRQSKGKFDEECPSFSPSLL